MTNVAPQIPTMAVGESRNAAMSFAGKLDSGESLTGSPTVAEVGTSDLSFSNEAVSTAQLTINDITVAVGHAVQFKIDGSGLVAGRTYQVKVIVPTDATPAQMLIGVGKFKAVS